MSWSMVPVKFQEGCQALYDGIHRDEINRSIGLAIVSCGHLCHLFQIHYDGCCQCCQATESCRSGGHRCAICRARVNDQGAQTP